MDATKLVRSHGPDLLSKIGGAANGGSARPEGERAEMDRENQQRQDEDRAGAASEPRQGSVGGLSNDNRSDPERASETRKD